MILNDFGRYKQALPSQKSDALGKLKYPLISPQIFKIKNDQISVISKIIIILSQTKS